MTISKEQYSEIVGDTFIEVRSAGCSLSSTDVQLISEWFERGVPVHIPRAVLAEVGERQAKQRGRVRSLAYVKEEVEARYAEWLDGRVGAHE